MANHRPRVPEPTKLVLLEEAGRKCANPGCANNLTQFHHIRQWHVYETHDSAHMIAVCAACHESVHRGLFRISDDELYRWKGIARTAQSTYYIFVEPGAAPLMLLGSLTAKGDSGLVVFDITDHHRLGFAVADQDLMILHMKLSAFDRRPLLDIVEGYVRRRDDSLRMEMRPGRVRVTSPGSSLLPPWAQLSVLRMFPSFDISALSVLDIRVVEPNVVKVEGIWFDEEHGVVITDNDLMVLRRSMPTPLVLRGEGRRSVLEYSGPVTDSLLERLGVRLDGRASGGDEP